MCLVGVVVRWYIYRFSHITYPYSSFLQQHSYFLFIFKMFFVLVYMWLCKFMSKLKQTSNAQNYKIKATIATFRPGRVFLGKHTITKQTEQQNTHYQFIVVLYLPEEDPSGSKRCNGCFDFKI